MDKSLLALLLVCAIAGMTYCASPSEVEEQDNEDAQRLIQATQGSSDNGRNGRPS